MPEARKQIVLHYHLFKNAGSSVDAALKDYFGDRWIMQEFPAPQQLDGNSNTDAVQEFLEAHPEIWALSSHTALLPVPSIAGVDIFPIIFLRHPIDRLRSAYAFGRKRQADTFSSKLARETDLAGYLRTFVRHPRNRVARNFHAYRLAFHDTAASGSEIERARRALETLPFVGLVEAYRPSFKELRRQLKLRFPGFSARRYKKNRTQAKGSTLASRLSDVRAEIGDDLYSELMEANADDMELFETVARRYQVELPPRDS